MRAVLYARVSQGNVKSVDDQLTDLRRWAAGAGATVVAEHRDDGVSASRYARGKARPGWTAVVDLVASGAVDAVAVWEVSRATRDRPVMAALLGVLAETGTVLVAGGREHDPSDPDDAFNLDIGAAVAVRESAQLAKRTRRGVAASAAAGRPSGPPHWGTRIEFDPSTGRALRRVEDGDTAPVVREVVRRLLAGENPTAVARDLNRRGVPTPAGGARWIGSNLLRTVAAPVMAGLRVHRGRVLDGVVGDWPALVTPDEYAQLQAILSDPARRTVRDGSHTTRLVVGIAVCGVCGAPVRTLTKRLARGPVVRYQCKIRYCVSRDADQVDELVRDVVVARLGRPDAVELLTAGDDPEQARAAAEMARLRARLAEARRLVDEDRLSLESLADLESRTLPRLRRAEAAARPRRVLPDAVSDLIGADASARWALLSTSTRRAVVRALVTVTLLPTGRRGRFSAFDPTSVRIDWR